VREGRRREFASFASFTGSAEEIPDPNDPATFAASRPDWSAADTERGRSFLARTRELLRLRHERLVPLLGAAGPNAGRVLAAEDGPVCVDWRLGDMNWSMRLNLAAVEHRAPAARGESIWADPRGQSEAMMEGRLPPTSLLVALCPTDGQEQKPRSGG
jgi:1,4-alpha-glucan branching enzyme